MNFTKKDLAVIDAFIDGKPKISLLLITDGKVLDGEWMGGSKIAVWENGKIRFNDLGSKAAQSVQNKIKKMAPRNLLGEGAIRFMKMSKLIEELEMVEASGSEAGSARKIEKMAEKKGVRIKIEKGKEYGFDKKWTYKVFDEKRSAWIEPTVGFDSFAELSDNLAQYLAARE